MHGSDALQAGIQLLPFAIFVSWSTVVAGQIQSRLRIVRPTTWVGYAIAILGFGLLYAYFNYDIAKSMQYGLLIIPAVGVGLSLQSPMLILQAAMPFKDMAAVTSAWVLTRSIGGSVGVSIFTAILNSDMRSEFAAVQRKWGEDGVAVPTSAGGYAAIHQMPDGPIKRDVLAAFANSFKPCWIVAVALLAVCLVITIPTRSYSLNRPMGAAAAAGAGAVGAGGAGGAGGADVAEAEAGAAEAEVAELNDVDGKGDQTPLGAEKDVVYPDLRTGEKDQQSVGSTPTAVSTVSGKERSRSRSRERQA